MNDLGDANVIGTILAVIFVICLFSIGANWNSRLDAHGRSWSLRGMVTLVIMSVFNIGLIGYMYFTTRHIQFVFNPTHKEIVLAIVEVCVSFLTIIVASSYWVHVMRQPRPVS